MTELSYVLPTVAVQTMANRPGKQQYDSDTRPFQLEGCHALAVSGPVVKRFYPTWYVDPQDSEAK